LGGAKFRYRKDWKRGPVKMPSSFSSINRRAQISKP
jgi:hypothetical protein